MIFQVVYQDISVCGKLKRSPAPQLLFYLYVNPVDKGLFLRLRFSQYYNTRKRATAMPRPFKISEHRLLKPRDRHSGVLEDPSGHYADAS